MDWPGIHRNVRWAILSTVVLVVAACTNSPSLPAHPATTHATPGPVTESFARHRFTVTLSAQALEEASADGRSLPQVVGQALSRINALLPGPPTTISISYNSSQVIPQTGTGGFTNPATGAITIWFRQTPQACFSMIMQLWLPRTLSHEVDHSVRRIGPGAHFITKVQIWARVVTFARTLGMKS